MMIDDIITHDVHVTVSTQKWLKRIFMKVSMDVTPLEFTSKSHFSNFLKSLIPM
jgi:hypothetical protein